MTLTTYSNPAERKATASKQNGGARRLIGAAFALLISGGAVLAVLGPAAPSHAADISELPLKAPKMTKVAGNAAAPNWVELTALQQHILEPLAPDWDNLKPSTRKKWLEISGRYVKMTPAEQERLQARMRGWVTLTPEQRRIARENYARANKLDTEQRALRWQQYQQLSEEQKKELAEQATPRHKRVTTLPPAASIKHKLTAPAQPASQKNAEQTAVIAPAAATAISVTPPAPVPTPAPASTAK
ncbi:putative transmembrane protein [Collimonas arenae]|uniref:Putative transmembrane protein n=1 Tax=Collimonas arenae TaxID=279058 RepID=A0A0A1FD39_9BURK|nr:DUF3106 domain-containing protein [Collimonas arenae]AIY42668.1 putative transmembrane protein [Collimonas arenae]